MLLWYLNKYLEFLGTLGKKFWNQQNKLDLKYNFFKDLGFVGESPTQKYKIFQLFFRRNATMPQFLRFFDQTGLKWKFKLRFTKVL